MRLIDATALTGPATHALARPGYDRDAVSPGIAHIGVGNFHRAHQALYIDRCLHDPAQKTWGICGIGLGGSAASRVKAQALGDQDCLYTLTESAPDGAISTRLIGAITDYRLAPDNPAAVLDMMADPAIRIVSLTITEGGYNIDPASGRFMSDHEDVRHDLANPASPRTAFGYIVEALDRRRKTGAGPFTVLSCDNQRGNGDVAREAVLGFARARDADLAAWIEQHVSFPNSMVDRIAPGVTADHGAAVTARTGFHDASPVVAEAFTQWVIEDDFCNGRPDLAAAGVELVEDVAPFEAMKGRLLNASHMMLAFPGLLAGYRLADEAMRDERMQSLLRAFMDRDVLPIIEGPQGVSLEDYRDEVMRRFSNPAVGDQLLRIASDGANKIPTFLAATLGTALDQKRDLNRLAFVLACFARYFAGMDDHGQRFVPIEPNLPPAIIESIARDPLALLTAPPLAALKLDRSSAFRHTFERALMLLDDHGALGALERLPIAS